MPGIPVFLVDAEFEIHAVEKRLFVRMRLYKQLRILNPLRSCPGFGSDCKEEGTALFEPIGHTISHSATPTNALLEMMPPETPVSSAVGGEVIVHHEIDLTHRQYGVIDLDLVCLREGYHSCCPRK